MSETNGNENSIPAARRGWRIAGGVLWIAVGISLLATWLLRSTDDVAGQASSDSESAQPDEPKQKVIRVLTGADGTINLSDILNGEEQPEGKTPPQTWNPNGVEDFSFTNCDGRTITKEDLLGRPWVACFVFTHCTSTCPMITLRMRELQDRLKHEDIRLVTFGVDPKRDTPDVLKAYAELNGADLSRWYFLSGDATEMYGLIQRSFQMPVKLPDDLTGNYQVPHSNNVMLVDERGVVQGKYLGTKEEDMAALVRELRRRLHPKSGDPEPASAQIITPMELPRDLHDSNIPGDAWYMRLPAVNAGLNGLSAALLALGYVLIKQGRPDAHKRVMLSAFAVSIAFLACYLVYHAALHQGTGEMGKKFTGTGVIRPIYFSILITHVILAAAVPVLALITIYRGLKEDWAKHRRIAKITFPIWMYVSVTGVIIYGMLYHWPTN